MLAQVAGIALDDATMASFVAALGSSRQSVEIDRAWIELQIRELALEHAAGSLGDEAYLARLGRHARTPWTGCARAPISRLKSGSPSTRSGETWTFLRRRDGHSSAVAFLDAVESADWLTVVQVDEGMEREARAWLRRHDERLYSFVDATSFIVMRRERIGEALAFDGDFSAAGFVEVRP